MAIALGSLGATDPRPDPIDARAVFTAALEDLRTAHPREFEERLVTFVDRWIDLVDVAADGDQATAKRLRRELIVGLGVLFDAGDTVRDLPFLGSMFEGVASEDEKLLRDRICASARIQGRHDAPKHFFLAAALVSRAGPAAAAQASLLKEFEDARRFELVPPRGSGFSYVDLAYDHAGIRFANRLLGWDDAATLTRPTPSLAAYLPDFLALELPEGIGWQQFQDEYRGAPTEATLDRIHDALEASVAAADARESAPEGDSKPEPPTDRAEPSTIRAEPSTIRTGPSPSEG